MPIAQQDIDRIADRADIVEVVSEYVRLEQRGERFWGLSPFKSEKTPSFCVDATRGLYYCFSTHQGGNIFTFLMNLEQLSFPEAVEALAKRYNVSYRRGGRDGEEGEAGGGGGKRKALLELYARVAASFHYLLGNSDEARPARDYLAARGLSAETLAAFSLGYCPARGRDWLWGFLSGKGYSAELLQQSGLFHARRQQQALFAGRIVFPITNRKDEVVGFGARSHTDAPPKYVNSPETILFKKRNELFGKLRSLIPLPSGKAEPLYLVEGYMDALALHQAQVTRAVATLGTAFSAEQARTVARISKHAILLFDADEAGRGAVVRAGRILQELEVEVSVCCPPEQSDPAELLRTNEKFRKNCHKFLAFHTKSMIQFLLENEFPEARFHNTVESDHALKRIFEYISSVPTVMRRELQLTQVADYLNTDRSSVLRDFNTWSRDGARRASRGRGGAAFGAAADAASAHGGGGAAFGAGADAASAHGDSVSAAQRNAQRFETECMAISICCPTEFSYLRAIVDQQCFVSKAAKYLYELQERAFQNGITASRELIEMIEYDRLKDYVIRTMVSQTTTDCPQTIADITHHLKRRYLLRNRAEQIALLRTLERDETLDNKRVQDVQLEIMYLNREILKQ